ncbi:MAG: hypothetical protein H0U76_03080 [Ktedonobacteraceae bacterium]|nr:hypothetical protein [Ktedonobacteraceae bacterium]
MPRLFQTSHVRHDSTGEVTNKVINSINPPPGLTPMYTLRDHTKSVRSLAWSPDGSLLA